MRVSRVIAWASAIGSSGLALSGCAQDENAEIIFIGPDSSTSDVHVDATKVDAAADATVIPHDAGRDSGVDSTFGFDMFVPPPKDGSADAGHDGAHDAGVDAHDAGHDAGMDGGHDAGFLVYFGPPGSTCSKEGTLQAKTCGICGMQKSTCIVRPDGGLHDDGGQEDAPSGHTDAGHDATVNHDAGHDRDAAAKDAGPALVWGEFGSCSGQIDGGCVPGTTATVACGICGTQMVTCEPDCEYGATNCANQVDGGCIPGSTAFEIVASCEADGGLPHDGGGVDAKAHDAGHDAHTHGHDAGHDSGHDAGVDAPVGHDGAVDGTIDAPAQDGAIVDGGIDAAPVASPIVAGNLQVCSNTCQVTTAPTCELPPTTLTIASQATGKVTTIVNFSATQETARLFPGTCPTTFTGIPLNTPYGFVTVVNSSATQKAHVSAWTWNVPGALLVPTRIAAYATTPTTPGEFESCLIGDNPYGSLVNSDSCFDTTDPTSCHPNYGGLMLSDSHGVPIPPGGSVVLFIQDKFNTANEIGPVEVTIRTENFE